MVDLRVKGHRKDLDRGLEMWEDFGDNDLVGTVNGMGV
jgi:hypothetical protein